MPTVTLTVKIPAELKERIRVEGENLDKKMGTHARDILEQHFTKQSVEQVTEHLAELTEAVQRLASRGSTEGGTSAFEILTEQVAVLDQQVRGLAATLTFVLRTLVYQKEELKPTQEDCDRLEEHFETIARNFGRGS